MQKVEIEEYLTQSLNMALQINGETSYNNSFNIRIVNDGFEFIPRMPASYIVSSELYEKNFSICSAALYPEFTLLKQTGAYFIPTDTTDIHVQRALFFPWKKGISQRLVISDISNFVSGLRPAVIPIMENFAISLENTVHIAIAGNSGSGKSHMLVYLLNVLKFNSELTIIDPKYDTPSRWGSDHNVKVIAPKANRSKSDFVSAVNSELSNCLELIHKRQQILFDEPEKSIELNHIVIVIDELLALSEGIAKPVKDSFFSLLSQIALLGRSSKIHLLLVSQRFDSNTLPVSCREQVNVLMQIGNVNKRTSQFLFPELDLSGIVIPQGIGTGIIQVIDAEHPYQILPLLTPTFNI